MGIEGFCCSQGREQSGAQPLRQEGIGQRGRITNSDNAIAVQWVVAIPNPQRPMTALPSLRIKAQAGQQGGQHLVVVATVRPRKVPIPTL